MALFDAFDNFYLSRKMSCSITFIPLFDGFENFFSSWKMSQNMSTREELNMHSLTLIPDDTLTLVAKMVFVQV